MRVVVTGTSGSGKTTLAGKLAARLGLERIELDAINWLPGWVGLNETDPAEFRRRVAQAVTAERWVVAGNYENSRPIVWARATHLVWLDYSRAVVMRRVIGRSVARALSGEELWPGTGNREDFRRWLDKEHPIRWAWDTFERRRANTQARLAEPMAAHLKVARLRRPREAEALLASDWFEPPRP